MNLSPHFTLAEAMASDYAARRGIDNTPPAAVVPRLEFVALTVLEPIRERFGSFSPTSWYRCPELNMAIGGATDSQHVKGEAADIKLPAVSNLDLARWIRDNLTFDQLILECWDGATPSSGWVHVSRVASGNRGQAGTFSKGRYDWTKLP